MAPIVFIGFHRDGMDGGVEAREVVWVGGVAREGGSNYDEEEEGEGGEGGEQSRGGREGRGGEDCGGGGEGDDGGDGEGSVVGVE